MIIKQICLVESCISFICINSCGASSKSRGYKLILLNNRDEAIDRLTKSASFWPQNQIWPDAKIFGPLDIANTCSTCYNDYSTWLGINEYGSVGNLLIYMHNTSYDKSQVYISRGNIVAEYLLKDSINYNSEQFLNDLEIVKSDYKGFNLILLEMSQQSENYDAYFYNNEIKNATYRRRLNENESKRYIFSISNNNMKDKFIKEQEGIKVFETLLGEYSKSTIRKKEFIDSLFQEILFNTKKYYPDYNLMKFLNINDTSEKSIENLKMMSSINANYSDWWNGAQTRTSTLILVDYDNRVEYVEFNLTSTGVWSSKNETFKLKIFTKSKELESYYFEFVLIFLISNISLRLL